MRSIRLEYVTEVLVPETGKTLTYPRMTEYWCAMMEDHGYVVTNTEIEINPDQEES